MYKAIFLLFAVAFVAEAKLNFHENISPEDRVHYFGTAEKDEVPDYEVVSPRHLEGSLKRRGLYEDKEPVEFVLRAFGEEYHLVLRHNKELISPGCLVDTVQSDGQKHVHPCPVDKDNCYYLGSSISHTNSSAAFSTCNGLHGILTIQGHDLVVQPIKKQHVPVLLSSQPVHKPRQYVADSNAHIVYKMSPSKRSCSLQAAANAMLKVPRREKRQAGKLYIEFLLTADKTMFQYHGNDLQRYMLTAANVAAGRYLDPSLQHEIYLQVVRIKILQDDQPGLVIRPDADSSLTSFCNWQEKFNPPDDNDPQHVDAATLMTRIDLVHLGVQSTTGLASLGGMCTKNIRCSILEDNGLDIGLTFAHETGHNLGMSHDGEDNICYDKTNIMSASGAGGSTAFQWSSCSVDALNNFLSSGKGYCMYDVPTSGITLPKDLPGVLYDGKDQCEIFIGKGSSLCTGTSLVDMYGGDECAKLVCFDPNIPGQCTGSQAPRMDGTECGKRKWCIHGACVDIGPDGPAPQDGGWSDWDAQWSPCSRSCGGGVRIKRRKCNNPKALFGGKPCEGFEEKAEICNMQPCSSSSSFKQEQCTATDKFPLYEQNFHFVPANVEGKDQCKLYCEVEGQSTVHLRSLDGKQEFIDGTDCSGDTGAFHRCVGGICRMFSCDGSTDSQRSYDKCGVCSGDNSSCKKVEGQYQRGEEKKYVTFAKIPAGSTSIYITNLNKFTVMSISVNGIRYFNGADGHRDRSGKYSGGGVTVDYRPSPERIIIGGPLTVDIEAQVYRLYGDGYQGVDPQISYEYYIPVPRSGASSVRWSTTDGPCSVTCSDGTRPVEAVCVGHNGARVEDYNCDMHSKPSTVKACHQPACPSQWEVGAFSACSKSCGGGQQTRNVQCIHMIGSTKMIVGSFNCPAGSKPAQSQACGTAACPGVWKAGAWSACSQTCARGTRTRAVKCYQDSSVGRDASLSQEVPDSACVAADKPAVTSSCIAAPCNPNISGDKCKDVQDCKAYGDNVCSEYLDWAKQNCQLFCGYCVKNPSAIQTDTSSSTCKDKLDNCAGYGKAACTQYKEWAHDNCAKFCDVCDTTAATTPAATTSAPASGSCVDANEQCEAYGDDVCTKYKEWAAQNCKKKCGLCEDECKDEAACIGQPSSVCTQYKEWAKKNCHKKCGYCGADKGKKCIDKIVNCPAYGKYVCTNYSEWAQINCQNFCGFCSADCKDVANCAAYGANVCTEYAEWSKHNCQKTCKLCSR